MFVRRLVLILGILILLLPACGGDDDDDATPMASQPTMTTQPTTTGTSGEPVKIGVLASWTGMTAVEGTYMADPTIKLVEKQVEDMGGILGGRPVEFIKYDTGGQVSAAAAGTRKLIIDDNVCALTIGGAAPTEMYATSEVAEEEKVFFSCVNAITGVENLHYTVEANMSTQALVDDVGDFMLNIASPKPETVGFLTFNSPEDREFIDRVKQRLEPAGIETVYENYITHDVVDLSPYLTKIKHADPDYFVASVDNSQFMAMAKQIMELGGWGNIQTIAFATASSAIKMPGADGWILITAWYLEKDDPASVKFREEFEAVNGSSPTDMHVYFYNSLWTAVHAIELAGTDDPMAIAEAARSGNLEFDTPMGMAYFDADGHSGLRNTYVQIQDKKMVAYPQ